MWTPLAQGRQRPDPHVVQGSPALAPNQPHSPEKPQAGTHLSTNGKAALTTAATDPLPADPVSPVR